MFTEGATAATGDKAEVKDDKVERSDKSRSRSRARKEEKKDVLTLDRIKVCTNLT